MYQGLHFYARGAQADPLLVRVPPARAYTSFDCVCTSTITSCSDVDQTSVLLGPEWQECYVPFNTLQPASQASGAPFDATTILRSKFEAPRASFFSFSLDALTFF